MKANATKERGPAMSNVPPPQDRISLGSVQDLLAIEGVAPSMPTLSRWCSRGRAAPGGRRVVLRAWRIGSRMFPTATAVDAFVAELSAPAGDEPRDASTYDAVDEQLAALGV